MTEEERYLEAARIVAECKPSKLPYVLAILREGGIEIEDRPRMPSINKLKGAKGKEKFLIESRGEKDPENWRDTSDETVLALRAAFKRGMNISLFSEASGINRSTVYKLMSAASKLSEYSRKRILVGLAAIEEKKEA